MDESFSDRPRALCFPARAGAVPAEGPTQQSPLSLPDQLIKRQLSLRSYCLIRKCYRIEWSPALSFRGDVRLSGSCVDELSGYRLPPLAHATLERAELAGLEAARVFLEKPLKEFLGCDIWLTLKPSEGFRPCTLERIGSGPPCAR